MPKTRNVLIVSSVAVVALLITSIVFLFMNFQRVTPIVVPAPVAATMNCTLVVPADPLNHLETPWQLQKPCNEANPNQAVFVQAVVFDKDTGVLSTYAPLVIDAGTQPAVVPVAPVLPAHRVVGIFGGSDGMVTTLAGAGAGLCDNGAAGRLFGQVFFCGTRGLFDAVQNTLIFHSSSTSFVYGLGAITVPAYSSHVTIPPLGTEASGLPCPTTRDFRIVDQDQSDNVTSTYLVTKGGQTAQNTAANRATLAAAGGFSIQKNGSDNRLLTSFVDPAIGCKPWTIPDLADPGSSLPTQATDELQAAAFQGTPTALIPAGDPMVGPNVLSMVNTYRIDIDQPRAASLADASTATYCENQAEVAHSWITFHAADFQGASPTVGMNLEAFLLDRLAAARVILKCAV